MLAFALCASFDVARALKVPPPLPRTVAFSPKPDAPGYFEMRQAKFFQDGTVKGGNAVSRMNPFSRRPRKVKL
jgi:hypothetical protein